MATYKENHGNNIPIVSSDPSNPIVGEVWYNTATNILKGQVQLTAAFSSGGDVPQTVQGGGGGGTKTAGWIAGGLQYPGDTKNKTWTYDGSTWTAGNNIPANYFIGGSTGPDSAGLLFDGIGSYGPGTATYHWDGTNWTAGGALPAIGPGGNSYTSGAGTQTAGLCIGGIGDPPPARVTRVLDYDGSAWTSGNSTPLTTAGTAADGPNAAAWIAGGDGGPGMSGKSFTYDSSSWTASGDLNAACPQGVQGNGWGSTTDAIMAGGASPTTSSQTYDGTSWASGASMSTARAQSSMCSAQTGSSNGFVAGASPPIHDETEEYQAAGPATVSITSS